MTADRHFYMVRNGEGTRYATEARLGCYCAIGWEALGDLSRLRDLAAIKRALKKGPWGYTTQQVSTQAGQVHRFANVIRPGDVIISPLGHGEYMHGTAGELFHEPHPADGCPYTNRRHVNWNTEVIRKDDMLTNLAYGLRSSLTVYSLDEYADELSALIKGEKYTPAEKPQTVRGLILDGLLNLDGEGFEHFIQHLLEVIGFQAEVTQYSGDKGIDVIGTLDAEGVADINLRIQAKRQRGSVSGDRISALRGSLEGGQLGCLITLSTFSRGAVEEAQAANKTPIKIVDGDDMAAIILRNYDGIDDQYKQLFGIRRKPRYNIDEQFEALDFDGTEDENEPETNARKMRFAGKDTIVCAAKDEGFESAYMKQYAWWAIRIREWKIPHIKYLAVYRVAPISAITHYAEVERIEPFGDEGKYKLVFKGKPSKLERIVPLGMKRNIKPQGPKYTSLDRIMNANTLDDLWG